MTSLPNTTFVCTNVAQPTSATEYYGNRGINLIRDNVYTALAGLAAATPSANAQTNVLSQASYTDTQLSNVTVWLKGFFNPKISSNYEFSLVTNGEAQLFVSTDATSANKVYICLLFFDLLSVCHELFLTLSLRIRKKCKKYESPHIFYWLNNLINLGSCCFNN